MDDLVVNYADVLSDLTFRRGEIERRIGAMQAELANIDAAITVLRPLAGEHITGGPRTNQIVAFVTDAGRWLSHAEIIHGLLPVVTSNTRERHSARTQIGQLVQRGFLRQEGKLLGLPDWTVPPVPVRLQDISVRTGRRANVSRVLSETKTPMHIKEICAEMARRGYDSDERCVASTLAMGSKSLHPYWRKVAPATYQTVNGSGPEAAT